MEQSDENKSNNKVKIYKKQYTERYSVWKNYMFKLVIDIPVKFTHFHGTFLKKIQLIMIKCKRRNMSTYTRTKCTNAKHGKLWDMFFSHCREMIKRTS